MSKKKILKHRWLLYSVILLLFAILYGRTLALKADYQKQIIAELETYGVEIETVKPAWLEKVPSFLSSFFERYANIRVTNEMYSFISNDRSKIVYLHLLRQFSELNNVESVRLEIYEENDRQIEHFLETTLEKHS